MVVFRLLGIALLTLLLLASFSVGVSADAKVRVRSFIPKNQDVVPVGSFTIFNVKTQVFVDGNVTNAVFRSAFSCEVTVSSFSASQGTVSFDPIQQEGMCTRVTWVIGNLSGSGGDNPAATLNVDLATNPGELSPAGEHTIKRQGRLNYDEGTNAFTVHDNDIVVTAE